MPFISRPRPLLRPLSGLAAVTACGLVLALGSLAFVPDTASAQDVPQTGEAPVEQVSPEPEGAAPGDVETPDVQSGDPEGERGPWDVSIPCENVQHPYQAELCQQWRTAEAAEETAQASRRSLGLSRLLMLTGAAATALLLLMFVPLFTAAFAARRAAGGVGGGLAAKGDREREQRAYVDVDRLEFIETPESEGVVKVRVDLRNSGQTPALKLRSAAEVGVRDVADEGLLPVMTLPGRSSLDPARPRLGRDAIATQVISCESPPKLADRVTNGEATILVWGFVEYADVFGGKHRTAFQYLCNAGTLETGQIFKPMIRGDENG